MPVGYGSAQLTYLADTATNRGANGEGQQEDKQEDDVDVGLTLNSGTLDRCRSTRA